MSITDTANPNLYDDGRSTQKGVESEGIEVMRIGAKIYAFVGLGLMVLMSRRKLR